MKFAGRRRFWILVALLCGQVVFLNGCASLKELGCSLCAAYCIPAPCPDGVPGYRG